VIASSVGVFVARSEENGDPHLALARGLGSSVCVELLGVAGACYWLFPEQWLKLAGASALGLVALILASATLLGGARGHGGGIAEARGVLRGGSGTLSAWALASGSRHAALLLCTVAAAALTSQMLGAASGVALGDRLGLLVALSAPLALTPYAVAVEALRCAARSARGIEAMAPADPETSRRVKKLDDGARSPAAVARSYLVACAGLLASAIAFVVPSSPEVGHRGILTGALGLLGAALSLLYAGVAVRRAARGGAESAAEVSRDLEAPAGPSEGLAPAPRYRASEEKCRQAGLSEGPLDTASACLPIVLLGIALELVYRGESPRLAAEAFAVVTAGAAAAALWVALTANGAHAVLSAVRRASRSDGDPASLAASVGAGSLADIVGNAASPAACSLALMATSIGLSTPFFR
jgi:K(+)-stimulated pyrophosphate-energized sodium pump